MWFSWIAGWQDVNRKRVANEAFERAERASEHVTRLRAILSHEVAALAADPSAGYWGRRALRIKAKIEHDLETRGTGAKLHWMFIPYILLFWYILVGQSVLFFQAFDAGAIARNLSNYPRVVLRFLSLVTFRYVTPTLVFRLTEDHLLSAVPSTTIYLGIVNSPARKIYGEAWLTWTVVIITSVFITIVSCRRLIFRGIEARIIGKTFDPDFTSRVRSVEANLRTAIAGHLDLMDEHESFSGSDETKQMILHGPSPLNNWTLMRNSMMRADFTELLATFNIVTQTDADAWTTAAVRYPDLPRPLGWICVIVFGNTRGRYPTGPKASGAVFTLLVITVAVVPFYHYALVMATALPWGVRGFLRVLLLVFDGDQPFRSVAQLIGAFVSAGLCDLPLSITLIATDFKALDNTKVLVVLSIITGVLFLTVSETIAPAFLYLMEKLGWVKKASRHHPRLAVQSGAGIELTG